jgi:predicted DNA-binding protein
MTRERLMVALDVLRSATRRDKPLSLRLSAEELRRLQNVARAQRVPVATLARVLVVTGLEGLEGNGK